MSDAKKAHKFIKDTPGATTFEVKEHLGVGLHKTRSIIDDLRRRGFVYNASSRCQLARYFSSDHVPKSGGRDERIDNDWHRFCFAPQSSQLREIVGRL